MPVAVKRGRGRPRKPPADVRSAKLNFAVTPSERKHFVTAAAASRMRMSDYLRARLHLGTVSTWVMPLAARVRIARGRKSTDDLVIACARSGITLRLLSDRLGCTHALLSQARRGKISIRRNLAKQIEALVDFKASKENWPKIAG